LTEQYNTLQHQNGESVMPEDSIRLLGPWEWQPLARTALRADGQAETLPGELPPPRRIWIPIRSTDPEITHFRGRVLYRRYFHWVSKLDYWERIWIYFESADYFASVRLNDVLLGEHEGALDPFTFPSQRYCKNATVWKSNSRYRTPPSRFNMQMDAPRDPGLCERPGLFLAK
jgi:hypothetical protein